MKIEDLIYLLDESKNKSYEHLLNAIMDWPNEVETVSDYYIAVKKFLKIENINVSLLEKSKLNINVNKHIWELESISELINFLKRNNDQLL